MLVHALFLVLAFYFLKKNPSAADFTVRWIGADADRLPDYSFELGVHHRLNCFEPTLWAAHGSRGGMAMLGSHAVRNQQHAHEKGV
jgi:hypothetical protein